MAYKIVLHPSVKSQLKKLDLPIVKQVLKKLRALSDHPYLGKPLGNKMGMNLTGYYKLYVFHKKIRIVYQVSERKILITVVGVGKREKGEIYLDVLKLIQS